MYVHYRNKDNNIHKSEAQTVMRLIPLGTVNNNLGPDRLAGPKALDPNFCTQPTL